MNGEVASTEELLGGLRPSPIAREPHPARLVPDRDANRVTRSGAATVVHRHLQGCVAVDRDWVQRIRDVLNAGLAIECRDARIRRCRTAGTGARSEERRVGKEWRSRWEGL